MSFSFDIDINNNNYMVEVHDCVDYNFEVYDNNDGLRVMNTKTYFPPWLYHIVSEDFHLKVREKIESLQDEIINCFVSEVKDGNK